MFTFPRCILFYAAVHSLLPARTLAFGRFKTEPTFDTVSMHILNVTNDKSLHDDDYIFITPDYYSEPRWGAQIWSIDGTLIWNGITALEFEAQDLKVCDYLGQLGTHLCVHEKLYDIDHYGAQRVFDHTYAPVATFSNTFELNNAANEHDFNMLPGGDSFLQLIYPRLDWDLRPYCGDKHGIVNEGCFQEVSVRSGEKVFGWCYLNQSGELWHTPLYFKGDWICNALTSNYTSQEAGNGDADRPWDYMHINSVDKNIEGDYIVSIRHFDSIIKIAGNNNRCGLKPGTIIWRLNGMFNDFTMSDFNFSKQHDARFLSTSKTEEVISFFDNGASFDSEPTADRSSSKIIRINNQTMTAQLEASYYGPGGESARAQGSTQVLPNGNVFTGWGRVPVLTEHSANGTLLFYAEIVAPQDERLKQYELFTYRARRFPWVGKPLWKPKVVGYSLGCTSGPHYPLMAYASWNGATEVKSWRFYTAISTEGPWRHVKTAEKRGFETAVTLSTPREWASPVPKALRVDALDKANEVIGSETVNFFIPGATIPQLLSCGTFGCNDYFDYTTEESAWSQCDRENVPRGIMHAVMVFLVVEFLSFLYYYTWRLIVRSETASARFRHAPLQLLADHVGHSGASARIAKQQLDGAYDEHALYGVC